MFNNNQLKSLPENIFKGQTTLRFVHLNDNNLTTLSENIFENQHELKELHLQNNQLSALPENMHLNGNQLKSLPANVFTKQFKMSWLNLNKNTKITNAITWNNFRWSRQLKACLMERKSIDNIAYKYFWEPNWQYCILFGII